MLGMKFLLGFNMNIRISEKTAVTFKVYTGLSTRYKIYNYQNTNNISQDGSVRPFYQEKGSRLYPVGIQMGIKVRLSRLVIPNIN